jgi:hypothetical protein
MTSAANPKRMPLFFALLVALAATPPSAPASTPGATDYSLAANWVCRPGAESACTSDLDAKVVGPEGAAKALPFAPAADPAIDCFYLYPTVSHEDATVSDLQDSPEIQEIANRQIGRLTSRCRMFAPVYRQVTLVGLREMMRGEVKEDVQEPDADVAAAWAYYLAHDNGGRGVVLIGHSQGTILLQRLIASTIDGTPQQQLLVSAFLAGDPSLAIPAGKKVGGTFAHVPLCSSKAQTGCVYAWGSYLAGDSSPIFRFGSPLDNGMVSACVNPAAPGGGSGSLKFFHHKGADAPTSDPPWIESVGELSGACRLDDSGHAFIVTVHPGPRSAYYRTLLKGAEILPGWGLHLEDIALVQGNILDVLDAEIAAWTGKH